MSTEPPTPEREDTDPVTQGTITIHYFARLREEAGCTEESVQTQAATARALYEEVRSRHGFGLSMETLKVAVNDRMSDWDAPLQDGDAVLFIPPVAGGGARTSSR